MPLSGSTCAPPVSISGYDHWNKQITVRTSRIWFCITCILKANLWKLTDCVFFCGDADRCGGGAARSALVTSFYTQVYLLSACNSKQSDVFSNVDPRNPPKYFDQSALFVEVVMTNLHLSLLLKYSPIGIVSIWLPYLSPPLYLNIVIDCIACIGRSI